MHVVKIHGNTDRDLKYGQLLRRAGQILVYAGPLSFLGLMGLLAVLFPSLNDPSVVSALLIFVISPCGFFFSAFLGYKIMYRGKQYEARGKAAPSEADTRQPVVYLRPFMLDEDSGGLSRRMILGGGMWPVLFSVEEQLADAVAPIGPLVAIGKPDEQLPAPGATRLYFSDTTWQTMVQDWLSKARVIIFRPGVSEGVWWELKEAVAARHPESLLLLVLKMKRSDYLSFSQLIRDRLDIRLPNFNEVSRWRYASGFIEFDGAWQARFLPLKAPILRGEPYMPLRAAFNHALQPIFTGLGVSWCPSPVSKFKLFCIAFGVLGLVMCTVGYLKS